MAIQQSHVKLDYALIKGCWLMPSRMIINVESITGYNNKLQSATEDMKFGLNNINSMTRVIKHDDSTDKPKKKLPHQATDDKKHPSIKPKENKPVKPIVPKSKSHETMLMGVTVVGAAVVGYFMF